MAKAQVIDKRAQKIRAMAEAAQECSRHNFLDDSGQKNTIAIRKLMCGGVSHMLERVVVIGGQTGQVRVHMLCPVLGGVFNQSSMPALDALRNNLPLEVNFSLFKSGRHRKPDLQTKPLAIIAGGIPEQRLYVARLNRDWLQFGAQDDRYDAHQAVVFNRLASPLIYESLINLAAAMRRDETQRIKVQSLHCFL